MPNEDSYLDDEDSYLDGFLETAFSASDTDSLFPKTFTGRDPTELPPRHPQYEVLDHIGRGAVGDVYLIQDRELGRKLALKVLRPAHMGDSALSECFREEARLCSQLPHPGIVPLHESGTLDDGRPFFTMKLVEGRSFAELLRSPERPKQRAQLLQILYRVCQGIAFAHARGVVHGDLKPQNIMIGRFGEAQIMDWGFALYTKQSPSLLASRTRAGTPANMAPEQSESVAEISPRTDVYGLGTMLFETLTGQSPHQTSNGIQRTPPALLRSQLVAAEAEQPLVDLTLRCLELEPEARFADASQVADALRAFIEGVAQRAHDMALRAAAAQASLDHSRRARRFALLAFLSILVGVVVIAALLLWSSIRQQQQLSTVTEQIAKARSEAVAKRALAQRDHNPLHWNQALAAAERADAIARSPGASKELQSASAQFLATMRAAHNRAQTLIKLIGKLERIGAHVGDDRSARELELQFAKTFASIGISDKHKPTAADLAKARKELNAPEILQGLDSWILLRKKHGLPHKEAWRLPFAYAQAIDIHLGHRQARQAYVDNDLASLLRMSKEDALKDIAAETLVFLGNSLFEMKAHKRSLSVYEHALRRYPGMHRVSHNLAILLDPTKPESQERSFRLLSMALATKPKSAHLHSDIAANRLAASAFEQAADWAQRAIALGSSTGRAHFILAIAQKQLGDDRSQKIMLERSHELGYFPATIFLADQALSENRYLKALPLLRSAFAQQPGHRALRLRLGLTHAQLAHKEEAAQHFKELAKAHPNWPQLYGHWALFLTRHGDFSGAEAAIAHALEVQGKETNNAKILDLARSVRASARNARKLLPQLRQGRYPHERKKMIQALWLCNVKGMPELGLRIFNELRAFGALPTTTMLNGIEIIARLALATKEAKRRQALLARVHQELDAELAAIVRVVKQFPKRAMQQRPLLERFLENPTMAKLDGLAGHPSGSHSVRSKVRQSLAAIDT